MTTKQVPDATEVLALLKPPDEREDWVLAWVRGDGGPDGLYDESDGAELSTGEARNAATLIESLLAALKEALRAQEYVAKDWGGLTPEEAANAAHFHLVRADALATPTPTGEEQ